MQNQIRDLPLADLKPTVQVYAIMNQHHQYEDVGTGTLQIVTDSDLSQPQHYIEVTSLENKQLILRSRLQARNNFQRQKSAIICWQDIEQFVSQQLALSFQKIDECDMYWKIVCEKIGKNYLQINGNEPLQNPSQENLAYILDKAKNSYNLIAFHIINSPKFMQDLKKIFFVFKEKSDTWGTGTIMRIIQQIFSHTDHKVINSFLLEENFTFLLQLYKEYTHINFPQIYQEKIKLKELITLSKQTNRNIEIFHHYTFFRDSMIDLSKNISLEQMLNVWIRQTEISILNNLIQEKILHQLVQFYTKSKKQCGQEAYKLKDAQQQIIAFLFQILWMLKLAQSQSLRKKYIDSFFQSGILKVLQQILQKNQFKILQLFDYICVRDPKQFLNFFRDQFRQNPSLNLNRIISKQFSSNKSNSMGTAIVNFLTTFISEIIDKKQYIEFFNGTFLFSIFSTCNIPFRNLSIIKLIFEKLNKITGLINVLLRTKFFYKLPLNNKIHKNDLLELFKVIKIVILLNGKNNIQKSLDQIQEQNKLFIEILQSGIFTYCLEYLKKNIDKNCLLVSSMLENISILSEVNFNLFTKFVQQFDFQLEEDSSSLLKVYLAKIQIKEVPKIENQLTRENMHGDNQRKQHYKNLQVQQEERYLLDDQQFGDQVQAKEGNADQQLRELLKMKKQIQKQRKEQNQKEDIKVNNEKKQPQNFTFTFNVDFQEP